MVDIKRIIAEEYKLFLEGKAEDLIQRFPELQPAYDMGIRNPQYLQWIQKRRAGEPVEDVVGLVKKFDTVKNRLKQAGKSPDIYAYKTAGLLRQAIEDLGASKGSEKRRLKQEETTYLGTFGDWTVAMPHTRESSCQLGKGTTWCTAATETQNLFLSYVARNDQNIILYYVIKKGGDSRADPTSKISIGFIDGEPRLGGDDGGVTVDASNKGYTASDLRSVFGEQYKPIMDAMRAHAAKIGGKHPAKEQMKKIANDPVALEKEIANKDQDGKYYFIKQLLDFNPSQEVLAKLSNDEDDSIRKLVAENPSTSPELLLKIAEDKFEIFTIRLVAIRNPSMSIESLVKFAENPHPGFRSAVANNRSTPPEVLSRLSEDGYGTIKNSVALNPSTPPEVLAKLSNDENDTIRRNIAENPSTPPELLAKLADSDDHGILTSVAENPSTPPEALTRLSDHGESYVRWTVAENPSTPPEVLAKLSNDEEIYVRELVAKNPNTPIEILLAFYNTEDERFRMALRYNPTYNAYKEKQTTEDEQDGLLDEKKKKKKKSKGKKDACYHKVRARYDVWPSAYASGALVKCRKVGAKNWGNKSKKNEGLELDDRLLQIIQEEYQAVIDEKKKRKKRKKAGTESSKESNLGDWFKRKGAPGKKGGWVDCNTCRKGKCKPCGRKDGEKRAKYPSCRPTPGACKEKGKGKSWGKKSAKSKK